MSSRGGGESSGGDSPRRREEVNSRSKAKSRIPLLQPSSVDNRSAVPSAAMSSRGEGGPNDCPQRRGESSSRSKAPGLSGERGVAPSTAALETGSGFAKVDGEAPTPHSAALGEAPTVVLCSSGKKMLNRKAVAGALDLDPKKSGVKIYMSRSMVPIDEETSEFLSSGSETDDIIVLQKKYISLKKKYVESLKCIANLKNSMLDEKDRNTTSHASKFESLLHEHLSSSSLAPVIGGIASAFQRFNEETSKRFTLGLEDLACAIGSLIPSKRKMEFHGNSSTDQAYVNNAEHLSRGQRPGCKPNKPNNSCSDLNQGALSEGSTEKLPISGSASISPSIDDRSTQKIPSSTEDSLTNKRGKKSLGDQSKNAGSASSPNTWLAEPVYDKSPNSLGIPSAPINHQALYPHDGAGLVGRPSGCQASSQEQQAKRNQDSAAATSSPHVAQHNATEMVMSVSIGGAIPDVQNFPMNCSQIYKGTDIGPSASTALGNPHQNVPDDSQFIFSTTNFVPNNLFSLEVSSFDLGLDDIDDVGEPYIGPHDQPIISRNLMSEAFSHQAQSVFKECPRSLINVSPDQCSTHSKMKADDDCQVMDNNPLPHASKDAIGDYCQTYCYTPAIGVPNNDVINLVSPNTTTHNSFEQRHINMRIQAEAMYNQGRFGGYSNHVKNLASCGVGPSYTTPIRVLQQIDQNIMNPSNNVASGSSTCKMATHEKRRQITGSRYTTHPYVCGYSRFNVSRADRCYYNSVLSLSMGQSSRLNAIIVRHDGPPAVTYSCLGHSLKPDGKVDNFLVNCFFRIFCMDNHPSKSKKHYFFNTVGVRFFSPHTHTPLFVYREIARCQAIFVYFLLCLICFQAEINFLFFILKNHFLKSRNKFKADDVKHEFEIAHRVRTLQSCEMIYFPIIHEGHWFLFIVNIKDISFVFLDTLHMEGSTFHMGIKDNIIANFSAAFTACATRSTINFHQFDTLYLRPHKQTRE